MFWGKKKEESFSPRKRNYPFTVKEQDLLKNYRLDNPVILPYIEALIISEIQPFFWQESSYPDIKRFESGVMFTGRQMTMPVFLSLKQKMLDSGFSFYKSDIVFLSKRFAEFYYFGIERNELLDIQHECYLLIPSNTQFNFMDKIHFECGEQSFLKEIVEKWKSEYSCEIVWFDNHELLLYFNKMPDNFDEFYDQYFQIVGCTFVSDISDDERKRKLIANLPLLYLNFKSY